MKNTIGCKIYSLDYLMNEILTDEDLHNLLDKNSLSYSLIVSMFRIIKSKKSNEEIINMCKEPTSFWYDKYTWSKEDQRKFENDLTKVYKNIYNYGDKRCQILADCWILEYGFKVT